MTPIIAELIKKGYMTNACCSGHVYYSNCSNYYDCVDHKEEQYEVEQGLGIDMPYIMFADDIRVPLDDLPESWNWEYSIPRSAAINGPEDIHKHRDFTFKPGDITPMFDNAKEGFNLCVRIDKNFAGLIRDDWAEYFGEDPYRFYKKVVEAHRHLYNWAKDLLEVKREE